MSRVSLYLFILSLAGFHPKAVGQQLRQITWPTNHASPPPQLNAEQEKLVPLFQMGLAMLPESSLMSVSGAGAALLGLPEHNADTLQKHLVRYYRKIENDPVYENAPSALAYCFSAQKPAKGQAMIYVPVKLTNRTPAILFLHGFGGSFLYYQHFLSASFPDYLIISPAYGISMAGVNSTYLGECLAAASKQLNHQIEKPTLIGLSAGGTGGFHELSRSQERYTQYICLAAYPPEYFKQVSCPVRIIAGGNEHFVKNGTLTRRTAKLQRAAMPITTKIIPGSDHFFLLTHEQETRKILQSWLKP